jgi:tryptophan halogenase
MNKINRICVLGGGTSGYLTALCLNKVLPNTKVTVIESSSIPIIGVGESTTPKLLRMLHDLLGFDLGEFYREVQPTWKLGVRYLWGDKKNLHTNNSLGFISPFLSMSLVDDINYNSLNSVLMNHQKSFMIQTDNPEKPYKSLALPHSYAYHLDNKRLSNFLKRKAKERGIEILDTKIEAAEVDEKGHIDHMVNDQGETFAFDFYVDCSGFRSILLGKTLQTPFESFKSSLFTDSAVVGNAKHNGIIKPYTEARTMDNGWQWNIPMHDEDHLGYIYSSSFCSADDAEKEFRKLNPGLGDVKTLKFKSGRHKNFIVNNVAAIGNSYGFIEALQSTALHMVITNIYALLLHLKNLEKGNDISSEINENLGEIWDKLRWFIAMQFKYNKRSQTDFWRTCNREADVSGIEELIRLYQENGPLHEVKSAFSQIQEAERHQIYGLFSHDFMLLVMGIQPNKLPYSITEKDRIYWKNRYSLWDRIAEKGLYQHEILKHVEEHPELIEFEKFFESPFILDGEFDLFNKVDIADFIIKT